MGKKQDVYQVITDRVIDGLKEKGLSWFKPWVDKNGNMIYPINHISGRAYKGINILMLTFTADSRGYEYNEWLTEASAIKKGNAIREEEKEFSTPVTLWKISYYDKEKKKWYSYKELKKLDDDVIKRLYKSFSPYSFNVYNIAQLEKAVKPKVETKKPETTEERTFNPIKKAETVYGGYNKKPSLRHGGDKAYYQPATHHVQMPEGKNFFSDDDYYKTLFHELVHSTGHKELLKRKTLVDYNGFGSETYSQEELVAEIGSNFLVAITGIAPQDSEKNTQAYINGWVKHLTDHPKEILYASSQAQKAVEFILGGK
jgi:antirestriction protein ArdC